MIDLHHPTWGAYQTFYDARPMIDPDSLTDEEEPGSVWEETALAIPNVPKKEHIPNDIYKIHGFRTRAPRWKHSAILATTRKRDHGFHELTWEPFPFRGRRQTIKLSQV